MVFSAIVSYHQVQVDNQELWQQLHCFEVSGTPDQQLEGMYSTPDPGLLFVRFQPLGGA